MAILTTGRQDYGILRSTIPLLRRTPGFEVLLWAGGMHLDPRFGEPLAVLKEDRAAPNRKLHFLSNPSEPTDDAAGAVREVGIAVKEDRPEALLLLGDRSETLAAAVAATIKRVPIVHLHGGEESEGSIDNACRHAVTKLSHLHLVSHSVHADRVIQMGEDPATVVVVGAPGLDNVYRDDLPDRGELEASLGMQLEPPIVLVTLHPATLGGPANGEVMAMAGAMARVQATYVITCPNSDEGGNVIREYWRAWSQSRTKVALIDSVGERRYWALLRMASAVLGNSSSGIIEAPALGVPVVNVGDRQRGRLRYGPVTDVPAETGPIVSALCSAVSSDRSGAGEPEQLYPPGPAAPRIVEALRLWQIPRPPRKCFRDSA